LGWGHISLALSVLAMLYVLSTGPVFKVYRQRNPPVFVHAIYKPLELLYDRVPIARRLFDWYFKKVWRIQMD